MPDILAPQNLAFAVALALLALIVVVQALGLGAWIGELDFDLDHDGPGSDGTDLGGGLVSLLGLGQVPLLVWLATLLACFALLGLAIQDFVTGVFGAPFPLGAASGAGLMAALPANAGLTRLIGRVWPRAETTAVPVDSLVGRRARIAVGTATQGNPARAVTHDRHGQLHNVMVEPHDPAEAFPEGTEVLLVRLEQGVFFAVEPQGGTWLGQIR